MPQGEATLPTATTVLVMTAAAMKAVEKWEVMVIDLLGAFLHAEMDNIVHIVLRRKIEVGRLNGKSDTKISYKHVSTGKRDKKDAVCSVNREHFMGV